MVAISLLAGCSGDPLYTEKRFVFGTLVEIKIYGTPQARAQQAAAAAFADLQEMDRTLSAWKPGSLGRTNQLLPTGEWFTVATSVLPTLEASKKLYRASDGLFNPAIGKLVGLWGFHSDELPQKPPTPEAVAQLVAQHPTMDDVELDGLRARGRNPAVQLDFGAIAKGRGVDVAIDRLRSLGIHDALVDAGGDLRVLGRHGDRPWRIGVRRPRGKGVFASVDMDTGEVIFTSGDYERFFEYEGRHYHHIIDPRDGYPARGTRSVTVLHDNGAAADAAATALFVAGPSRWQDIARRMGIDRVMLVDDDGQIHISRAMAQRVRFLDSPPPALQVVDLDAAD
jgi:thiamine biosynthesis lipoprotein